MGTGSGCGACGSRSRGGGAGGQRAAPPGGGAALRAAAAPAGRPMPRPRPAPPRRCSRTGSSAWTRPGCSGSGCPSACCGAGGGAGSEPKAPKDRLTLLRGPARRGPHAEPPSGSGWRDRPPRGFWRSRSVGAAAGSIAQAWAELSPPPGHLGLAAEAEAEAARSGRPAWSPQAVEPPMLRTEMPVGLGCPGRPGTAWPPRAWARISLRRGGCGPEGAGWVR